MSGLKNRKKREAEAEEIAPTMAEINQKFENGLVYLARHFGKRENATKARITDIYDSSFTLEWDFVPEKEDLSEQDTVADTYEKSGESAGEVQLETEDMTFASRVPLKSKAELIKYISELSKEAQVALKIDSADDTLSEMSESSRMVSFTPPSAFRIVMILSFLGTIYYISANKDYRDNALLTFFNKYVIGHKTASFIFNVCLVGHTVEAAIAFLLCKFASSFFPAEINSADTVKWVVGTFLLGVNCFIPLLNKVFNAFKVHAQQ
ncbi:hypothetical protein AYI69_g11106 [Smittium culicis]|uniref:Transmembrane protein n=1 Tax=Smittium culicis TaxID=133412 RepID=A0A1R1X129_9FUNG|nr:hypothetical protein AYI69_g11106 [Smittium culicis]